MVAPPRCADRPDRCGRAAARGEWPAAADPRPLLQALIGAVYLRVHVLREPVTPKHLRPLIEAVLAGRPR